MLSIILGLTSAVTWGAGDFTGGLAARRTGAIRAVFYGEIFGLLLLFAVVLATPQPMPDGKSILLSIVAGALGTIGLMLLYSAMAQGKMSIAAPVSALLAAALPVIVGMITAGFPGFFALFGFGFALAAVWLVSQSEDGIKDIVTHLSDLRLPLLAGIGFGLYFILMNAATRQTTFWPMVYSRSAGTLTMALFIILRRESFVPARAAWPVMILNGILDVGGNFFYVLAGQAGRLDVSAVLSSLFPGSTVILAWIILKERLTRTQWMGIVCALIAIILFTV
ncbi:MAG TPA: GRP family sugar transporter [Anaerolineales bacterium]